MSFARHVLLRTCIGSESHHQKGEQGAKRGVFMEFMGSIVGCTFRSPNLEQRDVTLWQWIPILGHHQDVGLGQVETLKKAT